MRFLLCALFFCCPALHAQQLAFPTAEGYGKYSKGGRGGKVFVISTLEPTGKGSLGEAISHKGPRTVVFGVSGTITGNFKIKNDYITIAGQSAPGDGICIKGSISVDANDVIIRYIRVRADPSGETDAVGGRYHKNIIFDHLSASWSSDEVMSLYHCENVTIQWCMITEACAKIIDGEDTGHRFGGIWGNQFSSYHHNLIAHNDSRNPRWGSGVGKNDYRNNVLYNWGYESCYGGEGIQAGDRRNPPIEFSMINMIGNYYKPGPATEEKVRRRIANPGSRGEGDKGSWFVSGNYVEGYPEITRDNWLGVDGDSFTKLDTSWDAMELNEEKPQAAFQSVLRSVGCSLPTRDSVDQRIVQEVLNGTATFGNNGIITRPEEVGGWPKLKRSVALKDSDQDGMPDDWETQNELKSDLDDSALDRDGDGYTNIEEYLNSLIK